MSFKGIFLRSVPHSPSISKSLPANFFSSSSLISALQKQIQNQKCSRLNYDYNKEIVTLGRSGKLKEARNLFDKMPHRDLVSYTSLITVYLKNNDLPSAENLFLSMPHRNVVVESAMIDGYAKAGRIDKARKLFDKMPHRNVFSWTSLVSGYLSDGLVGEARALFDRMPVKNNFSWTTMVSGCARNGLVSEARELFDRMPEKNVVSWTAMIRGYAENGGVDEARSLFDEMPWRNLYSWNVMISGYLENERVNEAVELFGSMPERNAVSWTAMVTGLARSGATEKAREYFDRMPRKDVVAWNAMITAYAQDGKMIEACELFNLMPERNIVTWNTLIDGYSRYGLGTEVFEYFKLMLSAINKPNETTFTSIVAACDTSNEVVQAHALIIRFGVDSDTLLTNALVTVYSRIGDMRSSQLAFERVVAKNVVSWTAMILTYSNHGCGKYALQVFARMLRAGEQPDEITFVGLLSACGHTGLLKKGERLFDSMSSVYGLEPKAEHYSCLIDLLGRAGRLEEAKTVVNRMPPGEQDEAVLGALLAACNLHGYPELASQVAEDLIKMEAVGSGVYVLLANTYAASGKWDDVARVRKKMKDRKVKKVPGFSQIEVNAKSHVFFVSNREHPQAKEIYTMLEDLLPQMKDMGYFERMLSLV